MNILNIIDEDGNLIPIPALQGPPGEQGKPGGTAELDDNVIAPDKIWSSEKIDYEIKNSSGGSHSGVSSITQDDLDGHTLNIVTDGIESSITIPVPTTLPASDVYDWAKAPNKPKYNYGEVGAAPENHKHTKEDITDFEHTHTTADISDFPSSMPASDVHSWAKAENKPTYTKDEIVDFPSSMPASDVYDWAKAATKPSYTASEVGACASNDSRLSNSRPASDVYAWAKASSKPSYTASEVGAVPKRENGYSYTGLASYYASSAPAYLRITIPKSTVTWEMCVIEFTIKQHYSQGLFGKLLFHGNWSSSAEWNTLYAVTSGRLSGIEVFTSDKQYIYIKGLSGYYTVTLDKMLIGDNAINHDLSNITMEPVTALPSTYQTVTMLSEILNTDSRLTNARPASDVYSWAKASTKPSYTAAEVSALPLTGGKMTGTLNINAPAGSYVEGIRIHPSTAGWTTIALCGTDNTGDTGTSANTWTIHGYQGNFYLSKNGASSSATQLTNVSGVWYANGQAIVLNNDSRLSNARTPVAHNQAASTITAGTLGGKVNANATAAATLANGQVRDITISTTDLTAGSSALTTGAIYMVYE